MDCYCTLQQLWLIKIPNLTIADILRNSPAAEIVNLQNLTVISLQNNQLSQFHQALLDLNLEVKWDTFYWKEGIYVKDNPFQKPPVEIVKQGRQAIIH